MIKRIAITGPESTGKSTLASSLSGYYHEPWVEEYARLYLKDIRLEYTFEDIELIARGQWERENLAASKASELLFCDTDFTVARIWSEVVFGRCSDWVNQMFHSSVYSLYLLCAPDLPWQPDPLRQNPYDRDDLFSRYKQALTSINVNFCVVSGSDESRMEKAVSFVNQFLQGEHI